MFRKTSPYRRHGKHIAKESYRVIAMKVVIKSRALCAIINSMIIQRSVLLDIAT